jgi:quinoprotein glucose dehydrogenase
MENDLRKQADIRPSSSRKNIFSAPGITGIIIVLIGITLLVLGIRLIGLGGSWYYAICGLALIASGALLIAWRREGLWLYGLVITGTLVWALAEVGLDGWKLFPRLFAPAVLGIWLCLPFIARKLNGRHSYAQRNAWWGAAACLALCVAIIALGYRTSNMFYQQYESIADAGPLPASNPPVKDGEWRYYGRTAGGDRFSPLTQITPQNVKQLEIAWEYRTGDMPAKSDTEKGKEFSFEATPTKVGDNLYFCTPHRHIISVNATTGKKNWEFNPQADNSKNVFKTCRGVAYYEGPADLACPRRIITTTGDARLVALDADTGNPCPNFGDKGFVSLTDHMGPVPAGFHFITSQPLVINDRIILGGWIYDNEAEGEPSGVVRAYNPVDGSLAWAWDLGRADPNAPLTPGEIYTRGTPNAWGTYTADPALGLVYLPMGNATPDYFGGNRRKFDDEYSSSIVALDIETGKERWHYQTVHHDLWDFDLPIGPSLVDLNTSQGVIPALVQTTKRGEFFLLDRRDGHPLTDVEERPVPQHPAAGEYLSPTQPFPIFPSVAPKLLHEADTWGVTPIDQALCRIDFRSRRYEGEFTPPTPPKYLAYAAFFGVTDWYGASIDPARKLLIVNSSYMPMAINMLTRKEAEEKGVAPPWGGWGQNFPQLGSVSNNPQYGTPYAMVIKPWLNALNVPCMAPPWGTLTAIDLNTRKIAWKRLFGTTYDTGPLGTHLPLALPTGIQSMGGSAVTASGVIFIGGTADNYFHAFDEKTGKLLWKDHLPAGGNATPITYTGADGRQYVVIAAGGHGGMQNKLGDYVVAYALPHA